MKPSPPLAVAAALLFSPDADALASFYRDALGLPLRRVAVAELPAHWACEVGQLYLSIWPAEAEACEQARPHRGGVAFYVRDVEAEFRRLEAWGVAVDFPPKRTGLGLIARLRDPDGNPFELYQPTPPPPRVAPGR